MGRKILASLAAMVCATTVLAQDASAPAPQTTDAVPPISPQPAKESFEGRLLTMHNGERAAMKVPALRWNDKLQADALEWAKHLAEIGTMQHAPTPNLHDPGENLWMGPIGVYSPESMIGLFIAEKRHFKPGNFPEVSSTGRWQDVGHYTQVIWPTTKEVGCALAKGQHYEFLVCRYFPAGNWRKKPVGFPVIEQTDPQPAS